VEKHSIMIVAGEPSGDKHGASLVRSLRALRPNDDWQIFGAAGDKMRAAGVETILDVNDVGIMGAAAVIARLPTFLQGFRNLRRAARERRPDAVVLIDWPDFNMPLSNRLKRDGQKVIYYISPQVWAWRTYRVKAIKRNVDRMIVILPFERDFYQRAGVNVDYVGHPLVDTVQVTATREEFCRRHGFETSHPIVGLLPGSRRSIMKFILPVVFEAVTLLEKTHPNLQFAVALAPTAARLEAEQQLAANGGLKNLRLVFDDTYNALAACRVSAVVSGTATLEAAIIGAPMVVVYRASWLDWNLFWPMINVESVALPNLIAGRNIVPELLQDQLTGERLAAELADLLDDAARREEMRKGLAEVRQKLGEAHASEKAAERILELIE
jgi:lipid-A-disaccharide synthase